jgi:hypothetical protein
MMISTKQHTQSIILVGNRTKDKREKIQALSLAKECYSMKLELLTNAIVVDDAIKFVTEQIIERYCCHDLFAS